MVTAGLYASQIPHAPAPRQGWLGSATPIDPVGAHLNRLHGVTVRIKKRACGGKKMTDGEIAYLTMVLVFFVAFLVVIGAASRTQDKRKSQ